MLLNAVILIKLMLFYIERIMNAFLIHITLNIQLEYEMIVI